MQNVAMIVSTKTLQELQVEKIKEFLTNVDIFPNGDHNEDGICLQLINIVNSTLFNFLQEARVLRQQETTACKNNCDGITGACSECPPPAQTPLETVPTPIDQDTVTA